MTFGLLPGMLYERRYKRDGWYAMPCARCSRMLVVSGAQINAGKRTCCSCQYARAADYYKDAP